jgi:CubicO group peptidase (beta-lactamase class C family)
MQRPTTILAYGLIVAFAHSVTLANAQQENLKQLTERFDKMLSEQFKPHEPGATALVARKGEIIYKKAFGMANLELNVPMQTEHVFKIASLTKQFTAVAILQLMEQGKLDLQDEITRFIPDYPTQGFKITIEHLLTHTSGIQSYSSVKDTAKRMAGDLTPKEMIDFFKDLPLRFAPGTQWEYSNSGYFLLGYIIETITGKTYGEFLEEKIFKPLGMTNSLYASDTKLVGNRVDGYTQGEKGFVNAPHVSMTHPYAAGAIQSTVRDLFTWNRGVHSYKLIKKESLKKALRRHTLTDGRQTSYGFGWRFGFIQDSPSIWHGGMINGFITMAIFLPEEDVFVAVFSNCDCNSPEDITARLAALAIGRPYEYKAIPVADAYLSGYAGVYENKKGQQRIISVSDQKLYSQLGRGPRSSINAYEHDKFFSDGDAMVTLEFTRNNKDEVENLVMKSREGNDVWNRTNKLIPSQEGVKLDEKTLERYVGNYEVTPEFTFSVTRVLDRLFVQATGQEQLEMFAESDTKFFLKVNDAQFEFITEDSDSVTKVVLNQGGRQAQATKIK